MRTILWDILACAGPDGCLVSAWHEESASYRGRRYSGCPSPLSSRAPPPNTPLAHFKLLLSKSVNPATVGRSLFSFPKSLRHLCRAGLKDCLVLDLVNAHPTIMSRRHPSLPALALYVNQRAQILQSIPTSRDLAKELFIRLLYGGSVEAWASDHDIADPLPPIVEHFQQDVAKARALDMEIDHPYGQVEADKLQYILNTRTEREAIDSIERMLLARGAQIHAYEHDGLCFTMKTHSAADLVDLASSACGLLCTVEPCKSLQECLAELIGESDLVGWKIGAPMEEEWEEEQALLAKARTEKLTSHSLFAKIVLAEPQVSEQLPWPIRDLFKLCPHSRELMWFDPSSSTWMEAAGGNGSGLLREYITDVLQSKVRNYGLSTEDRFLPESRWDFGNKFFREGVEAVIRPHLTTATDFHLDPESTRRYLNFEGVCWDRETEEWLPTDPRMLISRSTGWAYQPFENPLKDDLEAIFRLIGAAQTERGLQEPSSIPEELADRLLKVAAEVPELQFFLDLTGDCEVALYELTHLARGTFGLPMAEALFVRGAGRNGKDTVCNLMQHTLGTYATSVSCDALCSIPSADAPSPTFASLRARRFVAIREVAADQKMKPDVFKRFCDPASELSGRNLYDSPVRFRPQYLPFFCSNAPMNIDMDEAIKARTAIVDHTTIFTSSPQELNHRPWRDMSSVLLSMRPGFFWLLQTVYRYFLKGRPMRNVAPVPATSLDVKSVDCEQRAEKLWPAFIETKLRAVKSPSEASVCVDIEQACGAELGIPQGLASIALQGKGFERVRRKVGNCNQYFYRYYFKAQGMLALTPHYVQRKA